MKPTMLLAAALLGLGAATIPTATATAQSAPTTCMLHVHPWDDMSRRLELVHADGTTQVVLSVQDNRTTLGGERTFEVPATVRRVHWTWNRAAGAWRVDLGVDGACGMDPYPYWQDGSHPASLSMTVGQVPTTTTVAPTTTTTAQPPTSTTRPAVTTTTAPAPTSTTAVTPGATTTTTGPQPFVVQRTTPIPVACAPDACQPALVRPPGQRLPETGRYTWLQVRLVAALVLVGLACLQLAHIMLQDDEIEAEQ